MNERDEIGSDVAPDYMTSVQAGGLYGWPFSYYGQHVNSRVSPQNPELVAKAIAPDQPHSGYKVIFVPFAESKPSGMPVDVLTGFLNADEKAQGRPVGMVID